MDPREAPPPAFAFEGVDDTSVERAIAWLEALIRRPVERLEWWYLGRPYAARYQFADTRRGLVEAFDPGAAPWGVYRRSRAGGYGQPRADGVTRVDTFRIGDPDAVIAVRADGRVLPAPRLWGLAWYDCADEDLAGTAKPSSAYPSRVDS